MSEDIEESEIDYTEISNWRKLVAKLQSENARLQSENEKLQRTLDGKCFTFFERRGAESMARYLYLKVFPGDEVDVQESLDNWELQNNAK